MQVTQTSAERLKRELSIVVPAGDLESRFASRLDELKGTVQLKGFRPGKVPVSHLRRVFGRSVMAELIEKVIDEGSRQALTDRNERPAMQPEIKLTEDQTEIERVLSGTGDLAFRMSYEVIPEIKLADFSGLQLQREVAEVAADDLDKALADLAQRNVRFEAEADKAAEKGDQVTIDFLGKIDGEPFDGGKAEGQPVVIGQGGFIPGFEDGLLGARAGETRVIEATFPAEYPVAALAGKTASFETSIKEVGRPIVPVVDEEFAKGLGAESLDKLKEMVSAQIQREFDQISRSKLKRDLLDQLDKVHTLELPESLVNAEFDAIWTQLTRSMESSKQTFPIEGKSEEDAKAEYRKIAERRVRLGLVLGEVGDKNKIQVSQDELRRALIDQARQYPGQERMVYEFYEKNPGALQQLRAPIFEDKVVDFIVELAKPGERKVTREELLKQPDEASATAA